MLGRLLPVGYSNIGTQAYIDQLMTNTNTLLVDSRYSPKSYRAGWQRGALVKRYGDRYRFGGELLGNTSYKDKGHITIAHADEGIAKLIGYLEAGHDVILLCACKEYAGCHRKVLCDLVQARVPEVEIVQPPVASQSSVIKCLSIRQPYASWLTNPQWFVKAGIDPKTIENRDWSTSYRGPLLIHASGTFEDEALDYWWSHCPGLEHAVPMEKSAYPTKAIVGIAELVKCITYIDEESNDLWFCGDYGFLLANARPLEPVPYKGSLNLFNVDASIIKEAVTQ